MKHILRIQSLLFALFMSCVMFVAPACKHVTMEKSVQGTQSVLVGVGIAAEIQTEKIETAQALEMQRCKDAEDRAECLGTLNYDHAALLRDAGEVYDRVAEALEELRALAEVVDSKAVAADEVLKKAARDATERLR